MRHERHDGLTRFVIVISIYIDLTYRLVQFMLDFSLFFHLLRTLMCDLYLIWWWCVTYYTMITDID